MAESDIGVMPFAPALSATSDVPEPPEPAPAPEPAASDTPAAPAAVDSPDGEAGEVAADGDAPTAEPAEPPQLKRGRETAQERVQTATRLRREAEAREARVAAEAERLTAELARALEAVNRLTPKPVTETTVEPKPNREQFSDPDAYDAALVEWAASTSAKRVAADLERQAAEKQATDERARIERNAAEKWQRTTQTWNERKSKLTQSPDFADFDDVVMGEAAREVPITEHVTQAIFASDNGPQVLYHLIKNPQEAETIAILDPDAQKVAIGRLSERLSQPSRPQPRRLAAPIEPVASRNAAGPKHPNEMTTEEYAAYRDPQLKAERRASMWGTPRPH